MDRDVTLLKDNNLNKMDYNKNNNKIKILLNDNHLYSLIHFRKEVIIDLIKSGYDVIIVTPEPDQYVEIPQGVRSISVNMNRTAKGSSDILRYIKQLNAIFKQEKPDIVINYTIKPIIFGGIAAKINKINSIAFFAGVSTFISNILKSKSFKSKVCAKIISRILNLNKKLFFLNDYDISLMTNNNIIDSSKIVHLSGGEGVDLEEYSFIPEPLKSIENDKEFNVVMISRVLKTKGYREFVEAAKICKDKYPNMNFYLAGGIDIKHPDRIEKEEIDSDSRNCLFEYKGHISNLKGFLETADCVILPSYYNEGMNRSLMESLSMGIPIVTTSNRGCKELVIDCETGFVIPPKDSVSLANAIMKLYELPAEEIRLFRLKSRKYAEDRFDINKVKRIYKSTIQDVLHLSI